MLDAHNRTNVRNVPPLETRATYTGETGRHDDDDDDDDNNKLEK